MYRRMWRGGGLLQAESSRSPPLLRPTAHRESRHCLSSQHLVSGPRSPLARAAAVQRGCSLAVASSCAVGSGPSGSQGGARISNRALQEWRVQGLEFRAVMLRDDVGLQLCSGCRDRGRGSFCSEGPESGAES